MTHIVAEVSPGSIHNTECAQCGNEAIAFDVLALDMRGVGLMGTLTKCVTCQEET